MQLVREQRHIGAPAIKPFHPPVMSFVMSLLLWVTGGLLIGPHTPTGLGDWLTRQLSFLLDSSFFVESDRIQQCPASGPSSSGPPGQTVCVLQKMNLLGLQWTVGNRVFSRQEEAEPHSEVIFTGGRSTESDLGHRLVPEDRPLRVMSSYILRGPIRLPVASTLKRNFDQRRDSQIHHHCGRKDLTRCVWQQVELLEIHPPR